MPKTLVHAEAFCYMKYQSKDGSVVEFIWNSRDGVTPFGVRSLDGQTDLLHVNWEKDRFLPNFVPPLGMRIFVDMTPTIATPKIESLIDLYWNDPQFPMWATFKTKEIAKEQLLKDWCTPGAPALIVVTEEVRERFM